MRVVQVYRNLRHGRKARPLYSIRYKGRVIDRRHRVLLHNVQFIVNEAGRQRVIKEGRKNVHAYAQGILDDGRGAFGIDAWGPDLPAKLSYNPYQAGTFMWDQHPVTGARAALLNERGISACYLE